jgi:hypothetical protein
MAALGNNLLELRIFELELAQALSLLWSHKEVRDSAWLATTKSQLKFRMMNCDAPVLHRLFTETRAQVFRSGLIATRS